nr:MAG TPA: hypothetical protein [Caudoviricetes sp.]
MKYVVRDLNSNIKLESQKYIVQNARKLSN